MTRTILVIAALAAASLFANSVAQPRSTCANQVTPINNKIGELDEISCQELSRHQDVERKAEQGIPPRTPPTRRPWLLATPPTRPISRRPAVGTGLNGLHGTVENLDNYKPVANTTIQFGSDKATLTKADRADP